MSWEFYTKWWIAKKEDLAKLYSLDEAIFKKAKPLTDRNLANKLLGGLFAKYSMLVQDLDVCLDQMTHAQRRLTVRKLVDAAVIRLCELGDELKTVDMSEIHYIDNTLVELKLVPYDIELIHPSLLYLRPLSVEEMWKRIQNGEKIFIPPEPEPEEGEGEEGQTDQPKPEGAEGPVAVESEKKEKKKRPKAVFSPPVKILTPEEIAENERRRVLTVNVKIIQAAERGRQERLYFFEKEQEYRKRKRTTVCAEKIIPISPEVKKAAAAKIQRLWRGHSTRELMKFKERERRLLIGMYEPSWRSTEEFEILEENLEKRRIIRDQHIREYLDAIDQERTRIFRVVAPGLFEDIGDEIREWFYQWYTRARTFDKYPNEELGGTILVVRGETFTPEEYLDDYEKKRREKVKGKDKAAEKAAKEKLKKQEAEKKKKELEKKKKEAEAKAKKKKSKPGEFEFEYKETLSKALYEEGRKEYAEVWNDKDPFENPLDKIYMDMITDGKCLEVQVEIRKQVDVMMQIELEMLVYALELDRIRAKGKKGKPKIKKPKKGKKKKGKKGKKDPTGNRTTEDLFQELVDEGIIRTYPKARLSDFHGDFSYKNFELRAQDFNPPVAILDIRQAIIMNCVVPLGVQSMKRPRSVLIAGPRGSGKHLLANAIFNETRCVLFDLSPENTAGKYLGTKGMKQLLHLVNKMARLLSPSIIYFDAAEKIFYKKVPKEERELDPKRIGKKLVKGIVKTIKPEDRVLVLGITKQPWAGQAGKMKKAFERNILIPPPDYGSVMMYWRELLMPYHALDRNFDVTSLARVTVGYPFPVLRDVLQRILHPRRMIQLTWKQLTPAEVYEVFVSESIEPITEKEYKKFIKWYNSTPLGRSMGAFMKVADKKREQLAKANEKK